MKPLIPIPGELWKPIPGFPNHQISNMGRCQRSSPKGPVELSGRRDRLGYQHIGITRNKRQVWFLLHRLVANTFLSPPPAPKGKFITVNHKNRVRHDNRLENLELITMADNAKHWRKYPLHTVGH
jgi:hypothetical protein